jgi:hypothetical protein
MYCIMFYYLKIGVSQICSYPTHVDSINSYSILAVAVKVLNLRAGITKMYSCLKPQITYNKVYSVLLEIVDALASILLLAQY